MHIYLATNYDSGNWVLLARQKECLVEKTLICKQGGILQNVYLFRMRSMYNINQEHQPNY